MLVRRVSPNALFSGARVGWDGLVMRWCAAISRTMRCPPTGRRSRPSCTTSPRLEPGARAPQAKGPSDLDTHVAAHRTSAGAREDRAPISAATLHRQTREVGAECVSSARSDLSGGRGVTRVPTGANALPESPGRRSWNSARSPRESLAAVDHGQRDIHDAAVAQSMTKTPAVRAVIWPARPINRPNAGEACS